jgi:hypothetical protein
MKTDKPQRRRDGRGMNALRHGLLAETIVLEGEDPRRFRRLLTNFQRELQPAGEVQSALVETIAAARWRMLRLWGVEKAGLDEEIRCQEVDAAPGTRTALAMKSLSENSRFLDLINRYEVSYDRQFARCLERLRMLKEGGNDDFRVFGEETERDSDAAEV